MTIHDVEMYRRVPGLYRLWDLTQVIDRRFEYRVVYAEPTGDGTPLFAVFKGPGEILPVPGELQ